MCLDCSSNAQTWLIFLCDVCTWPWVWRMGLIWIYLISCWWKMNDLELIWSLDDEVEFNLTYNEHGIAPFENELTEIVIQWRNFKFNCSLLKFINSFWKWNNIVWNSVTDFKFGLIDFEIYIQFSKLVLRVFKLSYSFSIRINAYWSWHEKGIEFGIL